ncbi:hypothetical protein [Bacillus paramycoides]|uniref:hypothetical protein n=1 Tax=Bacillus paramycoides TaxID=2026194 RepID=UPI003D1D41D3
MNGYVLYKCLRCVHQQKLEVKKEDYSEVIVCPKCNGAFVDVFKINKYKGQVEVLEPNRLEKAMIIGIILRALRSKKKIKQYVGLERLADLIKVLDELQEKATLEEKEEAITSVINKLLDDLLEKDKG